MIRSRLIDLSLGQEEGMDVGNGVEDQLQFEEREKGGK